MNNRPLGKQLKILWLSTFIDKFDLSIDNYRQISSTIDLSTTFSMIDFDRHVTSWLQKVSSIEADIVSSAK